MYSVKDSLLKYVSILGEVQFSIRFWLMQDNFCCVNLIEISWRTWKNNRITTPLWHYELLVDSEQHFSLQLSFDPENNCQNPVTSSMSGAKIWTHIVFLYFVSVCEWMFIAESDKDNHDTSQTPTPCQRTRSNITFCNRCKLPCQVCWHQVQRNIQKASIDIEVWKRGAHNKLQTSDQSLPSQFPTTHFSGCGFL